MKGSDLRLGIASKSSVASKTNGASQSRVGGTPSSARSTGES